MINKGRGEGDKTNLRRSNNQRVPVNARQDIKQQLRIRLERVRHKLAVLGVQREGRRCGFARLDGAGQEVERQHLHACSSPFACWDLWVFWG